jgi:hypothetical protein
MKMLRSIVLASGLTAVVLSVSYFTSLFAQQGVPEDPRPAAVSQEELQPVPEDSIEVQTSGPIHEAFATPLTTELSEGIVVGQQPPEPIEELPPEQRPEGSNVVWIPGYFGWDEQRNDFLWISGFWRDIPPGRVWVSGYWTQAAAGFQWVPGFWTSAEQNEVTYLPQPPEIIETGPSIEQPSTNHFWVPGHWSWIGDHYVWRPGYWSRIHPDWVWVPPHYVWCPSGFVFVDGYWDYPVVRRGLLFAPAYFDPVIYRRPYYYTPSIVWSTHLLTRHLWVRPAYHHYYFGDYYDDRYVDRGFRPWYLSFTFGRVSYDPLFSYYRWYHRGDRDWVRDVRDRHDYYRRNRDHRPPRTYLDQQRIVSRAENRNVIRDTVVAAPITQIVNKTTVNNVTANVIDANFRTPFRFDRVAQQERRQIARQSDELRSVVRQRREVETRENVASVEGGQRKAAREGEDQRVRRPARRGLDISNVAQAMGATPDRRGEGAQRRGEETVRGLRGLDSAVRRATDEEGATAKGADTQPLDRGREKGRVRPDVDGPKRGPEIDRPDRGPVLVRPDRPRDVIQRDRAPDAKGPAAAPETKRPGRGPERKSRDAGPLDIQRDAIRSPESRPDLGRPDRGSPETRGSRRDLRDTGPSLPSLPGARPLEPPSRGRGPAMDRGPTGNRPPVERGSGARAREERIPRQVFSPDPASVMRLPRGLDREPTARPGRERPSTPIGRQSSRELSIPRGIAGGRPAEAAPQRRADPVAPLRFGGPRPSPRSDTVAPPQVRSRPEMSSAREPRVSPDRGRSAEPTGGEGGRKRGRDRD